MVKISELQPAVIQAVAGIDEKSVKYISPMIYAKMNYKSEKDQPLYDEKTMMIFAKSKVQEFCDYVCEASADATPYMYLKDWLEEEFGGVEND